MTVLPSEHILAYFYGFILTTFTDYATWLQMHGILLQVRRPRGAGSRTVVCTISTSLFRMEAFY